VGVVHVFVLAFSSVSSFLATAQPPAEQIWRESSEELLCSWWTESNTLGSSCFEKKKWSCTPNDMLDSLALRFLYDSANANF